jgi:tRNA-Thr(GGU) m(6)t(6)A37 methyltransferase TsaA
MKESHQVKLSPVGVIHSTSREPKGTPIQAAAVLPGSGRGQVEIFEQFREGLLDLDGFSHVLLIYFCHCARAWNLRVRPFLDDREHGVFATRAPARPNPVGLSVVRLLSVEEGMLSVEGLDVIDGTPLLDLKPYVPAFDCVAAERIGWLEGRVDAVSRTRDDGRFRAGERGETGEGRE